MQKEKGYRKGLISAAQQAYVLVLESCKMQRQVSVSANVHAADVGRRLADAFHELLARLDLLRHLGSQLRAGHWLPGQETGCGQGRERYGTITVHTGQRAHCVLVACRQTKRRDRKLVKVGDHRRQAHAEEAPCAPKSSSLRQTAPNVDYRGDSESNKDTSIENHVRHETAAVDVQQSRSNRTKQGKGVS